MEDVIITTSRLQPLHRDHLAFWKHLRSNYDEHLVICVLRKGRKEFRKEALEDPETFEEYSRWTHEPRNNPLSNWSRLRLTEIAVANDPQLLGNTTIMLRHRPDISWEDSIADLPDARTWAFNVTKSDFDSTKPDFYESKNEDVKRVEFGKPGGYSGKAIRERLREGENDLSFLPEECQRYFKDHCLPQFR